MHHSIDPPQPAKDFPELEKYYNQAESNARDLNDEYMKKASNILANGQRVIKFQ